MKKTIIFLLSNLFLINFVFADGHAIPKSGKISWMTGFQFNMNASEPQKDGWNLIHGAAVGSTFNTEGSGPLHEGRAMCTAALILSANLNTTKGNCYFGDKDGDRIFTTFSGDPIKNAGENIIIGGSGKYKGISGKGPWECDASVPGDNAAFNCRQTLTYKIN